jgi:hypothetical protein
MGKHTFHVGKRHRLHHFFMLKAPNRSLEVMKWKNNPWLITRKQAQTKNSNRNQWSRSWSECSQLARSPKRKITDNNKTIVLFLVELKSSCRFLRRRWLLGVVVGNTEKKLGLHSWEVGTTWKQPRNQHGIPTTNNQINLKPSLNRQNNPNHNQKTTLCYSEPNNNFPLNQIQPQQLRARNQK